MFLIWFIFFGEIEIVTLDEIKNIVGNIAEKYVVF